MKRIVIIFVIIAAIWGLFSAYWFTVQAKIKTGFEAAQVNLAQDNIILSNSTPETSGYPLKFMTDIDTLSYATPNGGSIKTTELSLSASSLKPTYWTIESRGTSRIELAQPGLMTSIFDVTPKYFKAVFGTGLSGNLKTLQLDLNDLNIVPISGSTPPVTQLREAVIDIGPTNGGLDFAINAQDLTLGGQTAATIGQLFGPHINNASMSGHAGGLKGLDQNSLIAWQDTGTLRVDDGAILWGGADLGTQMNLQLTPEGPNGQVSLKLGNEDKLLRTLTSSGMVKPKQAIRMALAFRAAPKSEDGKIEIAFPVKNGKVLFLGQTLTQIPPFDFTPPPEIP